MLSLRSTLLAAATLLTGCSESEPSPVPLGDYSYVAEMHLPDGGGTTRFQGTLTITKATDAELQTSWAVEGYDPREATADRIRGTSRYVLYAYVPPDEAIVVRHFITIGETSLPCEVQFFPASGVNDGTCTLTKD